MTPATWPRDEVGGPKLLVIHAAREPHAQLEHHRFRELPELLRPGDLLVVNDAATFPASLAGRLGDGEELEVRLLPPRAEPRTWQAVLFGRGDWHLKTEDRPPPPILYKNTRVTFGRSTSLVATVSNVSSLSPRLVDLRFNLEGPALWRELYRVGRPIQYSYLKQKLELWSVQTVYGARPVASEIPSAGRPLTWELILKLARNGIETRALTHATGLSSTGDPVLDAALPFVESFEIPEETVNAITETKRRGGRVIAVGTSVVRALEGRALQGGLRAGAGETGLLIHGGFRRSVVDGIVSGIHEVGESHFRLLESFAPRAVLEMAQAAAERNGYMTHEFGDATLILES